MWIDEGLYWAWRGKGDSTSPPPAKKHIEYTNIVGANGIEQKLATTVFNDEIPTEVNRHELQLHINHGAKSIHNSMSQVRC